MVTAFAAAVAAAAAAKVLLLDFGSNVAAPAANFRRIQRRAAGNRFGAFANTSTAEASSVTVAAVFPVVATESCASGGGAAAAPEIGIGRASAGSVSGGGGGSSASSSV